MVIANIPWKMSTYQSQTYLGSAPGRHGVPNKLQGKILYVSARLKLETS